MTVILKNTNTYIHTDTHIQVAYFGQCLETYYSWHPYVFSRWRKLKL